MRNTKSRSINRIRKHIIAKRLCDALIFLSFAVILVSYLVFIYGSTIKNPIPGVTPLPPRYNWFFSFEENFLKSFILPCVIAIIILSPISIILNNRLTILMVPHTKQISEQNMKGLKMRMRHDFLFRNYRGLYFKTYSPKKIQVSNYKIYW